MKKETENIISDGIKDGVKGGVVAAASSVITGAAITTVPVTVFIFWVVPTKEISVPIIVSAGVAGAIIGGGISAYLAHKKNNKIKKEFDEYLNSQK